jgi:O-antigen/teichoic acid export membrane protein
MSRTSRVLASVSLSYVQLALAALFGLWFTPFLLRHIGRSDFGLWSAGMPILTYVGLVDFGVLTIFQRDVAFALGEAQGDVRAARQLPTLVGTTFRLVLYQMPALLAGVGIAWMCLPRSWSALHVPLGITLGCLVVAFPMRVYHALLQGLQDLRFIGVLVIVTWAAGSAISAGLVFRGWGLNALAVSWSLTQFGTYAACGWRAKNRFPSALGGGLPRLAPGEAANRLGKGFWIIVSQLAVTLTSGADLLVIAAMLGPAEVTPYTITDKLVTMFNIVPFMIMTAAQPALSELSSSSGRERLPDVCTALTRVVLLVSGLIAAVVLVVDEGFVSWWVNPKEFGGGVLVLLLVIDMVVSHWTAATGYALFSFGHERLISITNVLSGVLATALTIFLMKPLGLLGAPVASIVARATVSLPALLVAIARATGGMVGGLLVSVFSWTWRMVLFSAAAIAAGRLWTPTSPLALATAALATAFVYAMVMLPLVLGEPLGTYTRPRFAALRQALVRRT